MTTRKQEQLTSNFTSAYFRSFFILCFALLLLAFPAAAIEGVLQTVETTYQGAYPAVASYRYEPHPVQPGTYFDVWLTIENQGQRVAEDIVVKVVPDFPFRVDSDNDGVQEIRSLQSFGRALTKFRVRVDPDALTGQRPLDFEVWHKGTTKPVLARVPVDIRTLDYILVLDSVDITPQPVAPGSEVVVTANVHNRGSTAIRTLKGSLELPDAFVPLGEGNQRVVNVLQGGAVSSLSYRLTVAPDAASGPYTLPLSVVFFDLDGTRLNQTFDLGAVVGSTPRLSILLDSTTLSQSQETGEAVVQFFNRGLEDVKFLHVTVEDTETIEVIGSREFYIGDVDSDDFESITLRLKTSSVDNQAHLVITYSYTDANNKEYTASTNLPIRLFTAKELGTEESNAFVIVILVLVLAGGGYYWYRRRKRSKPQGRR